jgi:diguanylate cyclase (GGDEF)-like protein
MMVPAKAVVRFGVIAFLASSAYALDPRKAVTQYRIDTWTPAHGLPHSSINRIGQDAQGYLWLATFGGAVRFDGVRFESLANSAATGPESDAVAQILEGPGGVRWLATGRGLVRRDENSTVLITRKEGLPANGIQILAFEPDGSVLVGTGLGLAIVDPRPPFKVEAPAEFNGMDVTSFHRDRKGRLWTGTRQGLRRRETDGRWTLVTEGNLGSLHIWSVVEDSNGTIWAATRLGGLVAWTEGRARPYTRRDGLAHDVVRSLATDRHGSLWVGTAGGGLNRFREGRFELLSAADGRLPSDVVRAIFEDREGNLWIGTAGGGLTRLSDLPFANLTTREGLPDDSVWTMTEDNDGTLWVGSNTGLVGIREGRRVEKLTEADEAKPIVLSLLSARDGRLLVGTYQGLFELRGLRLVRIDRPGELKSPVVRSLLETRAGSIWVGTERGLAEYRPKGNPRLVSARDGPDASVVVLRESAAGDVLLGLERGGVVRRHEGVFTREKWAEPLGPIRDLVEDDRGVLWVAGVGLGRMQSGRLTRFGAAEGFADRRIHALLFDSTGSLWMSTNTGIYRARRNELDAFARGSPTKPRFEQFLESEGSPAAEGNGGSQPAAWRTRDGRLWFATIRGVAGIDPVAASQAEPPTVARIRKALIDGGDVRRGAVLPVGVRRIEFEYTALRLTAPQQLRFRYRLDPVDTAWSDAFSRRSVAYASLGPGSYRFRVAAAGRDGVFLEDPEPFDFAVTPYLFERGIVRFGIVALVLVATLGGMTLRVRSLRRRGIELERIVAEKTRDLERLALEDALTGLANRRQFDRELEREVQRARRSSQPLALLMADVDWFKSYNDAYGHPQGDQCLRAIASVLQASSRRAGDLAARVGGEEFALLLPDSPAGLVEGVAERLRRSVLDHEIVHQSSVVGRVSLSIGVAVVGPKGLQTITPSALVETADQALYEAKAQGRNRVVITLVS